MASKQGGALVLVDSKLPSGTQVAITLQYAELLKNHFPVPKGAPCESLEECSIYGYTARFYVGTEPPVTHQSCGNSK